MRHGSLFSGIGGFDLAAEWMGWDNVFHCEWNEFGQKILKHYWPHAKSYGDITQTDFTIHRGTIDILTGGFPCQPYSTAGKRLGKEDDRHLWPEMLRAIREIQPTWIVGENVRGLVNWNGGLVFDEVQTDLETEGYEVTPFLLPACAVNAPHRRDRVWFIACNPKCATNGGDNTGKSKRKGVEMVREFVDQTGWQQGADHSKPSGEHGSYTHTPDPRPESLQSGGKDGIHGLKTSSSTNSKRQQGQGRAVQQIRTEKERDWEAGWSYNDGRWPTQSPVCSRNDGLSSGLDGITFSKWRNESIKAAGNAIVPQVVLQVFKAINEYQKTINNGL